MVVEWDILTDEEAWVGDATGRAGVDVEEKMGISQPQPIKTTHQPQRKKKKKNDNNNNGDGSISIITIIV